MYLEKWKKSEFRTVIKHLYLKGLMSKEIKADFARKIGCEENLGKMVAAFALRGE